MTSVALLTSSKFLSTPSARRATRGDPSPHRQGAISIHALREEGDPEPDPDHGCQAISIHALREEGDAKISQSATCCSMISIHALREEGDTHLCR